jgi:hypothetical protein
MHFEQKQIPRFARDDNLPSQAAWHNAQVRFNADPI